MRPGPWLLLSLLLSTVAAARGGSSAPALQRRALVPPSRPEQVPPLELHVAAGVVTHVRVETLPPPLVPVLAPHGGRIQLVQLDDGSLLLVSSTDLAPGEQVLLSVSTGAGAEPLRFALVTRRDAVDLQVRVVRASAPDEEDGTESLARSLLAAPVRGLSPRGLRHRRGCGRRWRTASSWSGPRGSSRARRGGGNSTSSRACFPRAPRGWKWRWTRRSPPANSNRCP